jgi:hypothetical protein
MEHEKTTQPAHRLLNLEFNISSTEEVLSPFLGSMPSNPC